MIPNITGVAPNNNNNSSISAFSEIMPYNRGVNQIPKQVRNIVKKPEKEWVSNDEV